MELNKCLLTLGAILRLVRLPVGAEEAWPVHEWGTFTSLQDEAGEAISGINTDDEPLPPFVHRLDTFVLLSPTEVPGIFFQGAPSCHPDVTMRLETPVIYFHPPAPAAVLPTASVRVKFRGGWLSEFYPQAALEVPGFENGRFQFGRLRSATESRLEWTDLKVGGYWPVTETSAHVWIAPRAVQAACLQTTNGESEKFLFYRGVAHINAPLKVSRDANSGELLFQSQLEGAPVHNSLRIPCLWLVDIEPGGKTAFRPLPSLVLDSHSKKYLAHTPADFAPEDFQADNPRRLQAALREALVAAGLYDDEALALLNTWKLSYFKSPGLRLFFLVPRAWTDFYLPLEISRPADIKRVMVGRIELVTPGQRKLLREIGSFSATEIREGAGQLFTNYYGQLFAGALNQEGNQNPEQLSRMIAKRDQDMAQVNTGLKTLASFTTVPKTYQTYLALGRFRNALILNQAKWHPAEGLTNFIATYHLQAYQPASTPLSL